jgi:hypothetical protein
VACADHDGLPSPTTGILSTRCRRSRSTSPATRTTSAAGRVTPQSGMGDRGGRRALIHGACSLLFSRGRWLSRRNPISWSQHQEESNGRDLTKNVDLSNGDRRGTGMSRPMNEKNV